MFSLTAFSQIETEASNITIECGDNLNIQNWLNANGGASASNACGTVVWSNDFSGINGSCSAQITVTFTATNTCGSFDTLAVLTLQDTEAPTIISPPFDVVIECGSDEPLPELIAEDNCSSNVSITFSEAILGASCIGEETITRTWTATDDCGNSTSYVQIISYVDYTAPSFTIPAADLSVFCDGSGNLGDLNNWLSTNAGAAASDVCSNVIWSNDFTTLNSNCTENVSVTVTFFATDDCGNQSSTQATFTIESTTNDCPDTQITLTSQAEVDAFAVNYPNCTSIENLDISGNNIIDLTPLSNLVQVSQIFIHDTGLLQDLSGLDNITSPSEILGPYVIIQDNQSLTDISSLSNLNTTSPNGYGGIGIRRNPSLLSLDGLQGFSTIVEFVDILDNDSLTNLNGLNNVIGADDFEIKGNDSLINLQGINSFTLGDILIENNASFQSLIGLNSGFSSGIQLVQNPIIENLEGLEVVASLFGLFLDNNSSLSDLSAIENIQIGSGTDATLVITNNPNLVICDYSSVCNTISSCESLFCSIQIENNAPGCNSIAEVAYECALIPSNDDCNNAINLELGQMVEAYNTFGTQSPQIPSCNNSVNRIDVWFSFNTGDEGVFDIVVEGGAFNLQVWEGDCFNLTQVPDACGMNQLLGATVQFNTEYYIQVWSDGTDRATGLFDISVDNTTLNVEDDEFNALVLFPNPVNSELHFKGMNIVSSISVLNALGQKVMTAFPKNLEGILDVSELSSGMYFVKVKTGNRLKTFKVIKH